LTLIEDTKTREEDPVMVLSVEALKLLDSLSSSTPDELVPTLAFIPQNNRVLMALLSTTLPTNLLRQCLRSLTLLASHPCLFRHFLTLSKDPSWTDETERKLDRLPQVERIAFFLFDTTRAGPEGDQLREHVLAFISTLAMAHSDALSILLSSYSLIPAMVLFLSNLANSFWEEDQGVVTEPTKVSALVELMNRTLSLLSYMVMSSPSRFDLGQKLVNMHQRPYNGIEHMFIVTMGRFSFADSPEWLEGDARWQLEQIADMARVLLEMVMQDGAAQEMVWGAFQFDSEKADKTASNHGENGGEEYDGTMDMPIEID